MSDDRDADREKVAAMMIRLSIATGHGDTIDDLLGELEAALKERGTDRDLAEAIHGAFSDERAVDEALSLWRDMPHLHPRDRFAVLLPRLAQYVIGDLLARRQREAARTGPWESSSGLTYRAVMDGPQEEDGYPGSLLPSKRGTP